MRLSAFCGARFDTDPSTAGSRAAPPYDQIDSEQRDELHRDKFQFAHLSRPIAESGDPHAKATGLYDEWLRQGVVRTDVSPALYPYEIEMSDGRRRLGICGLIGLEGPESKVIRPHEATVAKTVDERLSLLRRMQVDIEPILLIADDGGRLNPMLEADISQAPLLASHRDDSEATHRLYRIDAQDHIATYKAVLSGTTGVIADGHHRYTVARRFQQETKPDPAAAAAMKLMVVTSLGSDGLSIDPIHRGLSEPVDLASVRDLAAQTFAIPKTALNTLARIVEEANQPALGIGPIDGEFEMWIFDPENSPDSLDDNLRCLPVGWLHRAILPRLGFDQGADTNGTVSYRSDPARLLSEIESDRFSVGFWLPPMSGELFAQATANGEILPPKSTRFLPKLVSGLVWASHDCPVG